MVKKLNFWGKLLYCFTAFFPIYVYWSYYFYARIDSFKIENLFRYEQIYFLIAVLISITSIIVFYEILIKRRKKQDSEIFIKASEKDSKYMQYFVGSLSPFILFIIEIFKSTTVYNSGIILGSIAFVILGFIFIYKDEYGILYNLFLIRYKILKIRNKEGKEYIIITKKDSLSGYIRVMQLDRKVFLEWN